MADYDIRQDDGSVIDKIIFADGNESGATYIRLDSDGDIELNDSYIKSSDLTLYIKALQKAQSLGWGT